MGDDNTDNLLYGMTRESWEQWTDRVPHEPTGVNTDGEIEARLRR